MQKHFQVYKDILSAIWITSNKIRRLIFAKIFRHSMTKTFNIIFVEKEKFQIERHKREREKKKVSFLQ